MSCRSCVYCGLTDSGYESFRKVHAHHHPRKGMGGSKDWDGVLVPLCFAHHHDLHMKRWRLEVEDGKAMGYSRGGQLLFTRSLETGE